MSSINSVRVTGRNGKVAHRVLISFERSHEPNTDDQLKHQLKTNTTHSDWQGIICIMNTQKRTSYLYGMSCQARGKTPLAPIA